MGFCLLGLCCFCLFWFVWLSPSFRVFDLSGLLPLLLPTLSGKLSAVWGFFCWVRAPLPLIFWVSVYAMVSPCFLILPKSREIQGILAPPYCLSRHTTVVGKMPGHHSHCAWTWSFCVYPQKCLTAACEGCPSLAFSTEGFPHFYLPWVFSLRLDEGC